MKATFDLVYRTEGIRGLYRGVASPLLSLTILNTLNFTAYASFKSVLRVDTNRLLSDSFDFRIPIAAAAVGPLSAMVSTPFELVKTRMQMQRALPPQNQYRNSVHAMYRIFVQDGIKGLYVGHAVNTSREMLFLATYFSVYEYVKAFIGVVIPRFIAVPIAGGLSGAVGWMVSFPLDNAKSHIQSSTAGSSSTSLRLSSVLMHILREKGIIGLYAGVVPSVLRAFIVSSTRFSAYESTLWILSLNKSSS